MSATATSTQKTPQTGFRRFRPHLIKARWSFAGGLLAGGLYALSSGFGLPVMIKVLLPIFFAKEDEASPVVVAYARRFFGDEYAGKLLLAACLALPMVFLLRGIGSFLNRYLINKAGFIVLDGIRRDVFDRLQDLPLAFFHRQKSGDLVVRLIRDTEQLKNVIVNVSAEIIKQPLTLISSLSFLVYLSIKDRSALFTIVAIMSLPLCIIPIRFAARRLVKRSRQVARQGGDLGAFVTESLQSPLEIQAYNLQSRQKEQFSTRIRQIFRLNLKAVKYQAVVSPIIEVISVCGFVAALYFGVSQGMDYATFSALALALYMSYEPIKKLSGIHALIKIGGASLERLEFVLDAVDTVPEPVSPRAVPASSLDIVFDRVDFRYESANGPARHALVDLSVKVTPGETVALVGASGAGKSTFVALIPRFYDPTGGRITLGGVDVRELGKQSLRAHIAIVPQSPLLFNVTIAENIRVGKPGASDEDVRRAARRAFVSDFIDTLPQGYETIVGERGTSLSGGQRQRIAIARAFLKDAPILILDEATSALDSESEARIQLALTELVRGRTTFMIAHRFSSIRTATRILVFDAGRVVADGSHDQLYTDSPLYRDLYDHQYAAKAD